LARMLEGGVNFGLGATLACTREALAKIGGFEALVNRLADDYDLGTWIKRAGYKTALAHHVVETHAPDYDLQHFWQHQIRWNRTVCDARPWGYAGLIFTFAIFWALVTLGLARGGWWSVDLFATVIFCRYLMAFIAGQVVLGDGYVLRDIWLLWVRDVFGFL